MVTVGILHLCRASFPSSKVSTRDALAVSIAMFSDKSKGSGNCFISSATELPGEYQLERVITSTMRLNCAVHSNKDEIQLRGFLLAQAQSRNQLLFDPRKSCQLRTFLYTETETIRDGINLFSDWFVALELSFSSAVKHSSCEVMLLNTSSSQWISNGLCYRFLFIFFRQKSRSEGMEKSMRIIGAKAATVTHNCARGVCENCRSPDLDRRRSP